MSPRSENDWAPKCKMRYAKIKSVTLTKRRVLARTAFSSKTPNGGFSQLLGAGLRGEVRILLRFARGDFGNTLGEIEHAFRRAVRQKTVEGAGETSNPERWQARLCAGRSGRSRGSVKQGEVAASKLDHTKCVAGYASR